MKIVHLSNTPLSNAPANLAEVQRGAGYESITLLHRQANVNKVFVGGLTWGSMEAAFITHIIESADIIHLHNFTWTQEIFKAHPHLIPIVKRKTRLVQFHSPRNSTENFEDIINDPLFEGRRAVVAQYQMRQYTEAEHVVPNVLPIYNNRFTPLPPQARNRFLPLTVSFAPSNTNLRGWDYKGFDMVMPVLKKVERSGGITTDLITMTPYEETLIRKKWAHIGLEELVTGSYHLSFLEYMAFGCATICNMDVLTKEAMSKVVGEDAVEALPSLTASPFDLGQTLKSMCDNVDQTLSRGLACRQWMETHWNPNKLSRYFDGIYSQL